MKNYLSRIRKAINHTVLFIFSPYEHIYTPTHTHLETFFALHPCLYLERKTKTVVFGQLF